MLEHTTSGFTRRGLLGVFAATAVVAAPTYSNAFGLLRGAGDIRRIRMYSGRTGEMMDTIYWIEGEYIPEVAKEINHFMRDWRTDEKTKIDLRNVDIMAAAHRLMDVSEPYMLLSGYRSPATNAMLRSKSRGVAKSSLHMKGQAADLRLKSRSVGQMAKAAVAVQAGGVGRYSRSNFVHMDCGAVRTWAANLFLLPLPLPLLLKVPSGTFLCYPSRTCSGTSNRRPRPQIKSGFIQNPRHPLPPLPARETPAPPRTFPNCRRGWLAASHSPPSGNSA